MAKDIMGNVIKSGDKMMFNNMIVTVKEINENRIIGGKMIDKNRGMALKIPDSIVFELEFPFDSDKGPINGVVIKIPPETNAPEA